MSKTVSCEATADAIGGRFYECIRYGRFCPDCIRETVGGIRAAFSEDVGEKPKTEWKQEKRTKIYFMDRRWR